LATFHASWKTFKTSLLASSTDKTGIQNPIRNWSVTVLFLRLPLCVTLTSIPNRSMDVTRKCSTWTHSNKCCAVNFKSFPWFECSFDTIAMDSSVNISDPASRYSSTGMNPFGQHTKSTDKVYLGRHDAIKCKFGTIHGSIQRGCISKSSHPLSSARPHGGCTYAKCIAVSGTPATLLMLAVESIRSQGSSNHRNAFGLFCHSPKGTHSYCPLDTLWGPFYLDHKWNSQHLLTL
jgi:hypothetical protein